MPESLEMWVAPWREESQELETVAGEWLDAPLASVELATAMVQTKETINQPTATVWKKNAHWSRGGVAPLTRPYLPSS